MNRIMLNMAMAAIDFAAVDQGVATRILENTKDDGFRHQQIRVKYARKRLVKAQAQLEAAIALMRDD